MDKIELIPWDPTCPQHYKRMRDQRIACGWREAEVPEWKAAQLKGIKVVYWVVWAAMVHPLGDPPLLSVMQVLADSLPERTRLMDEHLRRYPNVSGPLQISEGIRTRQLNGPQEQEPLADTSTYMYTSTRNPTGREFIPVGHSGLEIIKLKDARDLDLPLSTVWIKHLYLSWYAHRSKPIPSPRTNLSAQRTLHSGGLGRSTMALTEHTATSPPLNATVVALDTIRREWQESDAFMKTMYDDRGMIRPARFRSLEEWYLRQGYEPIPGPEFVDWVYPETKDVERVPIVFLRKTVA